ncbi:unnamed protein product [Brassicogethes aeneus]|uniref:Protein ECT2 n=1 Tax=Brassicogethes aeneus TaxID=1431903 RepID=A0A9P0B6Z0_BRAAE|nr:unnamed protein product [Brassicogethes aeneus]
MDVVNAQIKSQSSICSESTGDETPAIIAPVDRRICLVGDLQNDDKLHTVAESFGVPVVTSSDGREYVDEKCSTVFVIKQFHGEIYNVLSKYKQCLLGPPALQQLAKKKEALPENTRPLYNLAMSGVVSCFTGFRVKEELTKIVPLIHHMGGSIRKDVSQKVTHLIANHAGGEKYHYATTFRVPIMNLNWVHSSWEKKDDLDFSASQDTFIMDYKLKPFHGAKVCFFGFPEDEEKHMTEILVGNGGTPTTIDDPGCTHVVVDESSRNDKQQPEAANKAHVVKAEWFWTSVQKEVSLEEKEYTLQEPPDNVLSPNARRDSHLATPGSQSRRKRKRLQNEIISSLAHQSPSVHKRRSSVSDAGLLSVSNSFLDYTQSPEGKANDGCVATADSPKKQVTARHQVFLELVQTEKNYVEILEVILNLFKRELEEQDDKLINSTEMNLIFGKLPPIYEAHSLMLKEFEFYKNSWTEDAKIGDTICKHKDKLQSAYPHFINYFEEMKETIMRCDTKYPRFHAFLKAKLTKQECGRQTLPELMIRPVQRLGSISLLLHDILKHTPKTNPDYASLELAMTMIREVMTNINEDKRKAECQVKIFTIFNEIDNCPPEIVSSHRHFIAKTDVTQLNSSEGLSSKGSNLVLFLFSDRLEVCKKKSKAFNSLKSPGVGGGGAQSKYKHVKLMTLNAIKRVIDVAESDECVNVFSLVCRHNDEIKERLYSFQVVANDEPEGRDAPKTLEKGEFLRTLSRQMANNSCTADADKFLAYLEPSQLDIDTDISNGTLSKARAFATRTRLKVGRAFSFNKTPSKLKRAVSSMMSPFGSSTNLTPASQLAQMKLQSYTNINELGNTENEDESPPVAPMSVQPTRKMKAGSLGVNSLKRL